MFALDHRRRHRLDQCRQCRDEFGHIARPTPLNERLQRRGRHGVPSAGIYPVEHLLHQSRDALRRRRQRLYRCRRTDFVERLNAGGTAVTIRGDEQRIRALARSDAE